MKLFWCPQTRAMRALWMMEEVGEPFELVRTDIREKEDPNRAELLTASPMGKVPALIDGDARFSESAAICLYLADKYAAGRLAPAVDAPERGKFLYWMYYGPAVIEPAMVEKFSGAAANKQMYGWGDFPTMISVLEEGLEGKDWIMGDQFTAADVLLGAGAFFMQKFGILPASDILSAYIDRCIARPAFKKALSMEEA